MTELDKQICNILSRSYPVNDNRPTAGHVAAEKCGKISVVGNHNVIISAELLAFETVLLVGFCIFLLSR